MRIATLTAVQAEWFVNAMQRAKDNGHTFQIGYDETDQSIKWKVGYGSWGPPYPTVDPDAWQECPRRNVFTSAVDHENWCEIHRPDHGPIIPNG